jgi:8-oxo-dGTP pyrophosphatase MutT (NUDIX family)
VASAAVRPEIIEGVVVVATRQAQLLMIRRATGIIAGGAWCFVGGAIERGEDQAQAGAREFREEVGASVRLVRKIWEHAHPNGLLRLHWWLGADIEGPLVANRAEVAEVRWCTIEEAERLPRLLASNAAFLAAVRRGEVSLLPG